MTPIRTVSQTLSNIVSLALLAGSAVAGPPDCPDAGTVLSEQKISDVEGSFGGALWPSGLFGGAAAHLGDVNGDGIDDLAVGSPRDGDGETESGSVWILFLNADGTVDSDQKISRTQGGFTGVVDGGDRFGTALAGVGDLDGDGVPDLAVGTPGDDDFPDVPSGNRGAVWILFLNADGTVKGHQKISSIAGGFGGTLDPFDDFGSSLAAVGDLDGDGNTELAAGAPRDDDGGSARGAVWILRLNDNGTVKSHAKISNTEGGFDGHLSDADFFGASVARIGDLDGDGVPELAVGGQVPGVWILFLNSDASVRTERSIAAGVPPTLASVGDLNGDGRSELMIGNQYQFNGPGAISITFLNADGTIAAQRVITEGQGGFGGALDDGDVFGSAGAWLGDLNGDGFGELAVGQMLDDGEDGINTGAVWILTLDDCILEPFITQQPASALLPGGGGMVQFSVQAGGDATLMYQWRRNEQDLQDGGSISGAHLPMLSIQATNGDIGFYDCVVTNNAGTAMSDAALLAILQSCETDLDGDGDTDFADLNRILGEFNTLCP